MTITTEIELDPRWERLIDNQLKSQIMSLVPSAGLGSGLSGGTCKPATWYVATTSYGENGNRAQPIILILDHDHPLQGEYDKVATSAARTVAGVLDTEAWTKVSALSFDDQEEVLAGMLNKQLQRTFSINGDSTFVGHKLKVASTDASGGKHLKEWSDNELKCGFERWTAEGGKWPLGDNAGDDPEQEPLDKTDGTETDHAPLTKSDGTETNEEGNRALYEDDGAETKEVLLAKSDDTEAKQADEI